MRLLSLDAANNQLRLTMKEEEVQRRLISSLSLSLSLARSCTYNMHSAPRTRRRRRFARDVVSELKTMLDKRLRRTSQPGDLVIEVI